MRSEDWQYAEGRLLSVRRARRLDEARVEISLLLTNNTPDSHSFQLPEPKFLWRLRLNTAEVHSADQEIECPAIDVAAHSVQLLTAIVTITPDSLAATSISKAAASEPAPAPKETENASAAAVTADH
jgi:pullulanase/glycogen debranching enzyme